jgi:DNA-binding CsgD family transcriptional regulator
MPRHQVSGYTRQRVGDRIERLATSGLDVASFLSQAGAALDRAVPSDTDTLPSPAWVTLDPGTLLITSAYAGGCEMPIEDVVHLEYASEMPSNRVGDVVRHPRGVQTARDVATADPGGARPYIELLRSIGVEHEALVALRTRDGAHWGAVYLVRGPGRPDFSSAELDLLRGVAPDLAEGIRRALLLNASSEPEVSDAPAIVVLREDLTPEWSTPGAQRWLSDLPGLERGALPAAVLSVAQVALAAGGGAPRGLPASARVCSEQRGWVVLHGQALSGDGGRRVAVTIQPAGPDRITPLLMAAYGLTEREEQVTRHVLRGDPTRQIAEALCVSPYTVQEHLKHVFAKTGVRSRRELVGRVFTRYHRRQVADDDHRIAPERPIRGGPVQGWTEPGEDGSHRSR